MKNPWTQINLDMKNPSMQINLDLKNPCMQINLDLKNPWMQNKSGFEESLTVRPSLLSGWRCFNVAAQVTHSDNNLTIWITNGDQNNHFKAIDRKRSFEHPIFPISLLHARRMPRYFRLGPADTSWFKLASFVMLQFSTSQHFPLHRLWHTPSDSE